MTTDGPSRYSIPRAVVHNVAGMAATCVSIRARSSGRPSLRARLRVGLRRRGRSPGAPAARPGDTRPGACSSTRASPASLDEARLRRALDAVAARARGRDECLTVVDCDDDDALDRARRELHGVGVPLTRSCRRLHVCLAHHPDGDVLMFNLNHAAVDGFGAAARARPPSRAPTRRTTAEQARAATSSACADLPVQVTPPTELADPAPRPARDGAAARRAVAAPPPRRRRAGDAHRVRLSPRRASGPVRCAPAPVRDALIAALHLAIARVERRARHAGPPDRRARARRSASRGAAGARDRATSRSTRACRRTRRERVPRRPRRGGRSRGTPNATRGRAPGSPSSRAAARGHAGAVGQAVQRGAASPSPATAGPTRRCSATSVMRGAELRRRRRRRSRGVVLPPSRSPRCLCLGAVTVAGRLHLTFRYPHDVLGPDAARRFADGYVAQLARVS